MERYADAIEPLLKDSGLRHRMGSAAKARIEQDFGVERLGERMQELLERAQQLRRDEPRPVPGRGLGRASATEAVELTRAIALADALWRSALDGRGTPTRFRAYLLLQRVGGPAYRWAVHTTRRGCRRCATPFAAV